jgi:hypothetical protein
MSGKLTIPPKSKNLPLPDEEPLVAEIEKTRHLLETQRIVKGK